MLNHYLVLNLRITVHFDCILGQLAARGGDFSRRTFLVLARFPKQAGLLLLPRSTRDALQHSATPAFEFAAGVAAGRKPPTGSIPMAHYSGRTKRRRLVVRLLLCQNPVLTPTASEQVAAAGWPGPERKYRSVPESSTGKGWPPPRGCPRQ